MNTYYIYILKCSDNSYYIGVTNNLDLRLNQHQQGVNKNSYTFNKRPVELVYQEEHTDIKKAIAREKQLKKWSRKKKEALINGDIDLLKILSKNNQ